ncbi:MAG: nickel-dependent lactate racemase [Armatimonadota bacterium]|jgi:nickel-dependent lactate racemase
MRVPLEYGRGTVDLDIADDRLAGIVEPKSVEQLPDVRRATEESLRQPIEAPPLGELLLGRRSVLVLTVDNTRPSPTPLLEPILDACDEAGAEATIGIAIGRHRQMTADEVTEHLGREIARRRSVVQHDPFDDAAHEDRGRTSRGTPIRINRMAFGQDLVLGVGIVEPTYLSGFTGGRKIVMPGIAHHSTIDANHYLSVDPHTRIGVLDGNPMHDDMMEVLERVPLAWITNAVVGPDDEVVAIFSGDPRTAHGEACARSAEIYACDGARAKIVIASPGGAPYDVCMVQTKKAIVPATDMVEEGGAVILVGENPERWGDEEAFEEWMTQLEPAEAVARAEERDRFSLGAHGARILAQPLVEKHAGVVLLTSQAMCDAAEDSFLQATTSMDEALAWARAKAGDDATVAVIRKARRVIVGDDWAS